MRVKRYGEHFQYPNSVPSQIFRSSPTWMTFCRNSYEVVPLSFWTLWYTFSEFYCRKCSAVRVQCLQRFQIRQMPRQKIDSHRCTWDAPLKPIDLSMKTHYMINLPRGIERNPILFGSKADKNLGKPEKYRRISFSVHSSGNSLSRKTRCSNG